MPALIGPDGKPAEWWIVELEGYGRTACPSYLLAQNARDILRDKGYPTPEPRLAVVGDMGDFLAIQATKQEILDEQNKMAAKLLLPSHMTKKR